MNLENNSIESELYSHKYTTVFEHNVVNSVSMIRFNNVKLNEFMDNFNI